MLDYVTIKTLTNKYADNLGNRSTIMKYVISSTINAMVFLLSLFALSSCTSVPTQSPISGSLPLNTAIPLLTRRFLTAAQANQKRFHLGEKLTIGIQPFREDINSDIPKVYYKTIEGLILETSQDEAFSDLAVQGLSTAVPTQDYLITGWISYQTHNQALRDAKKSYYIDASLLNLKIGQVVDQATIWLSDKELDLSPITESVIKPELEKNDKISKEQLEYLKLIDDANMALIAQEYERAIELYEEVLKQPEGRRIEVYSRLYSLYRRTGRQDEAERIFGEGIGVAIEQNNKLEITPLLFQAEGTEFDELKEAEYHMWLRKIGEYFSKNNLCFEVIGHTSCTGSEKLNLILSEKRAKKVQGIFMNDFPNLTGKTKVTGKGSEEAIVCDSNDEEAGRIDRRVEFKIIECSDI